MKSANSLRALFANDLVRAVGKFFVIGFGFRTAVKLELIFHERGRHNVIFAGSYEKQRGARGYFEVHRGAELPLRFLIAAWKRRKTLKVENGGRHVLWPARLRSNPGRSPPSIEKDLGD